jgi:hypothetical protein
MFSEWILTHYAIASFHTIKQLEYHSQLKSFIAIYISIFTALRNIRKKVEIVIEIIQKNLLAVYIVLVYRSGNFHSASITLVHIIAFCDEALHLHLHHDNSKSWILAFIAFCDETLQLFGKLINHLPC